MKLAVLSLIAFSFSLGSVRSLVAGEYQSAGYARPCASCADSKFQTPRYEQLRPINRHYEDRDRYNAAPCCGRASTPAPYVIKTVVVSKSRVPLYTVDSQGNQRCRRVLATTYKAFYSNGSCYVWTESR